MKNVTNSIFQLYAPGSVPFRNILLFVSDAAAYMKKAYEDGLKTLFPRIVHITCVCHGLRSVADHVRKQFPFVDIYRKLQKDFPKKSKKFAIFSFFCTYSAYTSSPCYYKMGNLAGGVYLLSREYGGNCRNYS